LFLSSSLLPSSSLSSSHHRTPLQTTRGIETGIETETAEETETETETETARAVTGAQEMASLATEGEGVVVGRKTKTDVGGVVVMGRAGMTAPEGGGERARTAEERGKKTRGAEPRGVRRVRIYLPADRKETGVLIVTAIAMVARNQTRSGGERRATVKVIYLFQLLIIIR
jgi:hypothetical protein